MCENYINNKKTPLRNSKSANKPFRSPLTTVLTPKHSKESPNNSSIQSPLEKDATPKRSIIGQCRQPIKRRRIDNLVICHLPKLKTDDEFSSDAQIVDLEKRISTKNKQRDNLKRSLQYIGQHKTEDLLMEIKKWRTATKEALLEFHKNIREKTLETVSMRQVLTMLGISEKIVELTEDEDDST
ncbi:uncharacterized protein [Venturia canescens]|uniref:uncharacterized protein n=1 Tax=Venturia canescens TaxID=32260 RepID=UPI001C9C85CC|nr:uncharacterized protein LOC122419367 [Venturia canescens]